MNYAISPLCAAWNGNISIICISTTSSHKLTSFLFRRQIFVSLFDWHIHCTSASHIHSFITVHITLATRSRYPTLKTGFFLHRVFWSQWTILKFNDNFNNDHWSQTIVNCVCCRFPSILLLWCCMMLRWYWPSWAWTIEQICSSMWWKVTCTFSDLGAYFEWNTKKNTDTRARERET